MDHSYWQKQADKPLFPELEWSKPENKQFAGKLLIVGGNSQGFAAPAESYGFAIKAGIGNARVLLPGSLQKTVSKLFPEAIFASANPSGGFAQNALAELVDASEWADGVLMAGDTARNSETTMLLENFLDKYDGRVIITKDAADVFCVQPYPILQRPHTLMVISLGQLQKLGSNARFARAFTSTMGLLQLVEALHEFTKRFAPYIITKYENNYVVAVKGQVSTTRAKPEMAIWRLQTASTAAVWWIHNPTKIIEALTMAIYAY